MSMRGILKGPLQQVCSIHRLDASTPESTSNSCLNAFHVSQPFPAHPRYVFIQSLRAAKHRNFLIGLVLYQRAVQSSEYIKEIVPHSFIKENGVSADLVQC